MNAKFWVQAFVQTALQEQADRPDLNDTDTRGHCQRSSNSPPSTDASQEGSSNSSGQVGSLERARSIVHPQASQDHVAAMWLKHDLQSLADVQVRQIAKLLTALCLDDAVDLAWMQRTKNTWMMAIRRSIQQQSPQSAAKSTSPKTKLSSKAGKLGAADKVAMWSLLCILHGLLKCGRPFDLSQTFSQVVNMLQCLPLPGWG